LVSLSVYVKADRTFVGQKPIIMISVTDHSNACGTTVKNCLLLHFEGGAIGCNPASNYIAINFNEPNYKSIEAMAYISFTSKKKFKAYATSEYCKDAATIGINDVAIYD